MTSILSCELEVLQFTMEYVFAQLKTQTLHKLIKLSRTNTVGVGFSISLLRKLNLFLFVISCNDFIYKRKNH